MRRVYSKIRRGILRIYKYYDKYRNVRNYFVIASCFILVDWTNPDIEFLHGSCKIVGMYTLIEAIKENP